MTKDGKLSARERDTLLRVEGFSTHGLSVRRRRARPPTTASQCTTPTRQSTFWTSSPIRQGVSDMLKDAFNAALIAFCIFAGTWLLAWMLSVGWFSWLY